MHDHERVAGTGRLLVRVPLIPRYTATEDNLRAIAALVRAIDPAIPVELMNYNPLAAAKYRRMGMANEFADVTSGVAPPSSSR